MQNSIFEKIQLENELDEDEDEDEMNKNVILQHKQT